MTVTKVAVSNPRADFNGAKIVLTIQDDYHPKRIGDIVAWIDTAYITPLKIHRGIVLFGHLDVHAYAPTKQPDEVNRYGDVTQEIYDGGREILYRDRDGKVIDTQSFSRP